MLRELTQGYSNAVIGEHLGMSAKNVRNYIQEMMQMTGIRDRVELAVRVSKAGLVNSDF